MKNKMKVKGIVETEFTISEEEQKRITVEYLRNKIGIDDDCFISNGKLLCHVEDWYGAHSSNSVKEVRSATALDMAVFDVIKLLSHNI